MLIQVERETVHRIRRSGCLGLGQRFRIDVASGVACERKLGFQLLQEFNNPQDQAKNMLIITFLFRFLPNFILLLILPNYETVYFFGS